jgi:hypothetical protein
MNDKGKLDETGFGFRKNTNRTITNAGPRNESTSG